MAKQKPALDLGTLDSTAGDTHNPVDLIENQQAGVTKSRIGKVAIQGWFEKPLRRKLKKLAFERDVTMASLLEEALEDLCKKHRL